MKFAQSSFQMWRKLVFYVVWKSFRVKWEESFQLKIYFTNLLIRSCSRMKSMEDDQRPILHSNLGFLSDRSARENCIGARRNCNSPLHEFEPINVSATFALNCWPESLSLSLSHSPSLNCFGGPALDPQLFLIWIHYIYSKRANPGLNDISDNNSYNCRSVR